MGNGEAVPIGTYPNPFSTKELNNNYWNAHVKTSIELSVINLFMTTMSSTFILKWGLLDIIITRHKNPEE